MDKLDLFERPLDRRRFLHQAGAAAASASLLAGVGGAASTLAAKAAASPPPNGGKPITITFWNPWPPPSPNAAFYAKMIAAYQKAFPNVTIKLDSIPWATHWPKLQAATQTGTGPDLDAFHIVYFSQFYNAGLLAPYPDSLFPLDQLRREYSLLDVAVADGKLYAMPEDFTIPVLLYNKDVWQKAGLSEKDAPKTWDDAIRMGKELTIRSNGVVKRWGLNIGGTTGGGNWVWFIEDLYYQLGGYFYNPDGTKVIYNNAQMAQAIALQNDLVKKYGLGDWTSDTPSLLAEGKNAMMRAWAWMVGLAMQANPHANLGALPLPTFTGKPRPYGAGVLTVNFAVMSQAPADRRDTAFHFIHWLFLSGDRIAKNVDAANIDGGVVTYKPAQSQQTGLVIPIIRQHGTDAVYTEDLPTDVENPLIRAIQQITLSNADPKSALDQAAATANHSLRGRRLFDREHAKL